MRQLRHKTRNSSQQAQILPLMAILLGLGAGVMIVLGALGDRAVRVAQADAVADAVALAATAGGTVAAVRIATANGFTVEDILWQQNSTPAEHCLVSVKVREASRSPAGSGTLANLWRISGLVSSKARALTNQPCLDPPPLK